MKHLNLNEFKYILGYEDKYKINMKGEVKNCKTNRILKSYNNQIRLYKSNKSNSYNIHNLIRITFGTTIEFEIFKKYSNKVSNVKYITHEGEIYNYDNYYVNEYGDVFSIFINKVLNPCKDYNNYYSVILKNKESRKKLKIHRIVASTYIPNNNPEKIEICHINGNKLDNNISNLRWMYPKSIPIPIIAYDTINGNSLKFNSISEASRNYRISINHIRNILNKEKTYKGLKFISIKKE